MPRRAHVIVLVALAALVPAACGSSSKSTSSTASTTATSTKSSVNPNAKEKAPPGDIPDSTQFVRFAVPGAGYSLVVPEGWARTGSGGNLTFTSNLNSVSLGGAKLASVAALKTDMKHFKLQSVGSIKRSGQSATRIRFLATSKPNDVTGKSVDEAAEAYVYTHNGRKVIVILAGPKGADNVDAWRTISNSVKWQ